MFPTVADVVGSSMPSAAACPRSSAGERGLSRPVRWVHISELPDAAKLLRGGELILATGIALPEDREGLQRYVRDLAQVDAAGLVIELGRRYADQLRARPGRRRRAGRAPGGHAPPRDALRRHHRGRARPDHRRAARRTPGLRGGAPGVQRAGRRGRRAADVVRQASRMSGRPVVLENLAHQVLAYDAAGMRPESLLDHWENRSRQVRLASRTGFDDRTGWLVTMVGARGHDWGPADPGRRRHRSPQQQSMLWNAPPRPSPSTGSWCATARASNARPTAPCCPASSRTPTRSPKSRCVPARWA
ncbi:PucR family transcriptional regulator ligand-binding domain-containing protein [Yinghuangia aomiensis]